MPPLARALAILRSLHWRRGLRAGFAVATAMIVCRILGQPMGWAALGGFEAVLVDNGGPYRTRLFTIAAVLLGGALCGSIGALALPNLILAAAVTAAVCFAVTYARVASQPIANTAVIILVIYFAGFGAADHTLHAALANDLRYFLGGLWAAVLSLFLWPVDPFRPVRVEVAACYDLLANFTASLPALAHDPTARDDERDPATDFKRQLRARLESARAALGATAARAPARTVRARNLSVLLETADMLFSVTIRLTNLVEAMPVDLAAPAVTPAAVNDIARWLSRAETTIANALRTRPADHADSFNPQGSHRIEFVTRRATQLAMQTPTADPLASFFLSAQLEALQNIEIAFEALRAVWTGSEARPGRLALPQKSGAPFMPESHPGMSGVQPSPVDTAPAWIDALHQNWSLHSVMMRHALRMAVVGAVDVVLIQTLHIGHGFWLATTSIIVLQPYSSGTVRKGLQRVAGTIGGGILAALLAGTIHNQAGIIAVITACAVLTLALYAIDYGWYSFFLTPTFVLLSLPYLRDWRFAGVRIGTTLLGAVVSILAMRILWPQSLRVELARLLARCASANASYLRATLQWWSAPAAERRIAERRILAPARRACGLTSQDAEEALDRVMLEPGLPALGLGTSPARRHALETDAALTFATYTRRFTQCLTTLASVGTSDASTIARLTTLSYRLAAVCSVLDHQSDCAPTAPQVPPQQLPATTIDTTSLAEQMLQRMERQAGVLERAAVIIVQPAIPTAVADMESRHFSVTP